MSWVRRNGMRCGLRPSACRTRLKRSIQARFRACFLSCNVVTLCRMAQGCRVMSGFADRQGIAPGSAACRLALAALMLLVGGSLALAANAVHLIQGDQNERTLQS